MMDYNQKKTAYGSINEKELTLFSHYLCEKCGIMIPPEKAYMFETRLSKMMVDAGASSFEEFYQYIQSGADPAIEQKIINAMVVNETLWFRDVTCWKVMEEQLLPRLIVELQSGRKEKVRIWCAAVSTGQEIYSTVMCVDRYLKIRKPAGVTLSDFEFLGTDISSTVLDIARKGRYDSISIMRGLDEFYRNAYFVKDNAAWNLDTTIRDAVKFIHFNLKSSYLGFGTFDIIFCRYVLIYFPMELQQEIISRMHGSLTAGGVFFPGNYAFFDLFEAGYEANYDGNLTYYTKRR